MITQQSFVDGLRRAVLGVIPKDWQKVLQQPPGRKPDERLVKASNWYRSLSAEDRESVLFVIEGVARGTLLLTLDVLDGAVQWEDLDARGALELRHIDRNNVVTVLASPELPGSLHELL